MAGTLLQRLPVKRPFYGWYIVFGGAVTNAMSVAMLGIGFGIFIDIFRNAFGWSVTAIAIGYSIKSFESGILSPFTGLLQDKWGPRKTSIMGTLLIGGALLLYSQVRNLPMYYAGAALIALGQSLGGGNAFSTAIVRWFNRKRGRAIGVLNIGNGLGFYGPLFTAALIAALEWRGALMVMAVVYVAVGLSVALLIKETPESMGLLPDGEPSGLAGGVGEGKPRRRRSMYGMEVKEAMKTPAFYLLVIAAAAQSFSHSSWNALQIPHFKANGFSIASVGVLLGAYGTCQVFLRPSVGWLGDKLGRRRVFLATFAFHGIGLLSFAYLGPKTLWLVPAYFIVFGLGHASQNTLGQSVMADFYGTKRFATLRGLRQSLTLPAAILAPIFSGFMFDRTGDYQSGFTILAFVSLAGWAFQAMVRRPFYDDLPEAMKAKPAVEPAAERPA